jgi:hypothetical protein
MKKSFGVLVAGLLLVVGCGGGGGGGGDSSSDIETWLIEVGNDFPDEAKCVADEMQAYTVSDFEASMAGTASDAFEQELDAVYEKCDAALGITTEE